MRGLYRNTRNNHAPFWGKKLMAPAWYKEDKMPKFFDQWNTRLGLESIKMRHMLEEYSSADKDDQKRLASQKAEIQAYIGKSQAHEKARGMKDVYITDHTRKQERYNTLNAGEDQDFFKYAQSVAEFNATSTTPETSTQLEYSSKYKRGSLAQRMFDPLASAKRLSNGTLFVEVNEAELGDISEDRLRK
jgi:hypothetical protein